MFENVLFSLCMVYNELVLSEKKVPARIVAEADSGNNSYGRASLNLTAQTAMRMPGFVATTLRVLASSEDP